MRKTILLAEDEENDAILIRRAFVDAEIKAPIEVVPDGGEAIRFLSRKGKYANLERFGLPSLLLLDLRMGAVSGRDVLVWLQDKPEIKARLPVVVLSSLDEEREMVKAYQLGANSYLVKPFDFAELVALARMVGNYWLGLNRVPEFCVEPGPESLVR
jgi:DNA-binding response OmpR family regulator